jgi:hypothetical protein
MFYFFKKIFFKNYLYLFSLNKTIIFLLVLIIKFIIIKVLYINVSFYFFNIIISFIKKL